jgi:hypothetical protein
VLWIGRRRRHYGQTRRGMRPTLHDFAVRSSAPRRGLQHMDRQHRCRRLRAEPSRVAFDPAFGRSTLTPERRRGQLSLQTSCHQSARIDEAFTTGCDAAGPDKHLHCLRHSYVTHLIEFDYPEKFVSTQVAHTYAATKGIYTGVSDEYRNRLLQRALGRRPELWGGPMIKKMGYQWNLRKTMATRDMFATRTRHPPLRRTGLPPCHHDAATPQPRYVGRAVRHPRRRRRGSDRNHGHQHPGLQDRR